MALCLVCAGSADAQRKYSKEESAQLDAQFKPWGDWGPVHVFPGPDTDELNLVFRKEPKPAESRIPAHVVERMTDAYFEVKLSDESIDSIFQTFPKIKSIQVDEKAWSPRIGIKAAELKGIKELWLDNNCDVAPEDLKAIGQMKSLEVLMLSGNQRIGPALDSLANLTQLRQLSLQDVPIPEFKKIQWLANNIKLTSLCLDGTGIGDEAVPMLKTLPNLKIPILDKKTSLKALDELYNSRQTPNEESQRK